MHDVKRRVTVSVFHAACGVRLCRIRRASGSGWYDAFLTIGRQMERERRRCPRCHMVVRLLGMLPSVDDEQFVPVKKADESGLVGFSPTQGAAPGERI